MKPKCNVCLPDQSSRIKQNSQLLAQVMKSNPDQNGEMRSRETGMNRNCICIYSELCRPIRKCPAVTECAS